jgi:hypothetical protein
MRYYGLVIVASGLLLAAGQAGGLLSYADEAKVDSQGLILGKWRLVDPEVKQTLEFSKDGALKLITTHLVVNGKKLPLGEKDGKPIEATLHGKYKFTSDSTIEGEVKNPFRDSDSKTLPLRWKSVSVSKDQLTFDAEGRAHKYRRVK